jgi:hypothetical protein
MNISDQMHKRLLINGIRLVAGLLFGCCALVACAPAPFTTYSGVGVDEKDKIVWTNMRDLQTAAEHFAANHGGDKYPTEIDDDFKSYLPGGAEDGRTPRPVGLINPFNGSNEWPTLGSVKDVLSVRNAPPPIIRPGGIEYSSLEGGAGYAIIGGGHDGKALTDYDGKTLVFTNFTDEDLAEKKSGANVRQPDK